MISSRPIASELLPHMELTYVWVHDFYELRGSKSALQFVLLTEARRNLYRQHFKKSLLVILGKFKHLSHHAVCVRTGT
jgi:hypothetical protein